MSNSDLNAKRPLSPHLQIYKPLPTMVMSIMHRILGVALYFGTVLLAIWLTAIAGGEASYETASWFFGSFLGLLILFGYTWALIHHMLGGIRHFFWDLGYGFDKDFATKTAYGMAIASVSLTLLVWLVGYIAR